MLTDKVRVETDTASLEPEDVLADAASLFPDDALNSHGYPGTTIVYASRFGDIRLRASDPGSEEDRSLFAHYLWNAGIYCADKLESGVWDVTNQAVLELGAGLGLCGIIAAKCDASRIVLSDYPAKRILETLTANVKSNLPISRFLNTAVVGHEWGDSSDELWLSNPHAFSTVIASDCFWMPQFHRELAQSMSHFLSRELHSRIYAVAAFHTGRAKLARFFSVIEEEGLIIESIEEVDIHGTTRAWATELERGPESVTERKRWLVIAILKHKS